MAIFMARQSKGRIYKSGKKNIYHLQYYVNSKQFVETLKDENGEKITRADKAKIAADKILRPIMAREQADRLRLVANELLAAETKAEAAEADYINSRATIAHGWSLFMSCPKRPASCKRYPASKIPRHSTAGNYQGYYNRLVEWLNSKHSSLRLISEITPTIAGAFMDSIQAEFASGTFNKYLQFFNCFFDTLAEAGQVNVKNPFKDIDRMNHTYNSKKPLTVEQIAKLIDTATGDMRLLIALGYFTGLRLGDCCTLQWREIDLIRRIIERIPRKIEHTVKDQAQAKVKIGIPQYLFQILAKVTDDQRTGYLLPEYAELYLEGKDHPINKFIAKHFQKCGIETHRLGTGRKVVTDPETGEPVINKRTGKPKRTGSRAIVEVGFHSLRYSYISHNAEAGTPAAVIQRNAGHASPAMTEHYTKISDDAAVKYAQVMRLPDNSIIDIQTVSEQKPERQELAELSRTLPIEKVRDILNILKSASDNIQA